MNSVNHNVKKLPPIFIFLLLILVRFYNALEWSTKAQFALCRFIWDQRPWNRLFSRALLLYFLWMLSFIHPRKWRRSGGIILRSDLSPFHEPFLQWPFPFSFCSLGTRTRGHEPIYLVMDLCCGTLNKRSLTILSFAL